MIHLENWSVCGSEADLYTPPEAGHRSLHGVVSNHPKFKDGTEITTSSIVNVCGNIVTTYSGSVYTLGTPHPEYVEWCRYHAGHVPNETEPIKVHNADVQSL